jgi:hypothetical protein
VNLRADTLTLQSPVVSGFLEPFQFWYLSSASCSSRAFIARLHRAQFFLIGEPREPYTSIRTKHHPGVFQRFSERGKLRNECALRAHCSTAQPVEESKHLATTRSACVPECRRFNADF